MNARMLAYRRSWTRIRDYTTERAYRQLVKQHDVSHVPTIVLKEFAQLGFRAAFRWTFVAALFSSIF